MADKSVTPAERGTGSDVILSVINGLCDLQALAQAGEAMSNRTGNADAHNMGRIMSMIHDLAHGFIRQLDMVESAQVTKEVGAA